MLFPSPYEARPRLTDQQFATYATRIGLDAKALLQEDRGLAQVEKCALRHLFSIPFDTTRLHIKDHELESDEAVDFMAGPGIPELFPEMFDLLIEQKRGSMCYPLNILFSSFLRYLGYKVAEHHTRTNAAYHTSDFFWAIATHIVLFVTIDGQQYLVDVGFSSGSSVKPVPVQGEVEVGSLSPTESFYVKHEPMPGLQEADYPEMPPGWSLCRRFAKSADGEPIESVVYHVYPLILTPIDIAGYTALLSNSNGLSERRPLQHRLIVNDLLPDGSRRNLAYFKGDKEARYYVRSGMRGKIVEEDHFPATHQNIYKCMREKFGMFNDNSKGV